MDTMTTPQWESPTPGQFGPYQPGAPFAAPAPPPPPPPPPKKRRGLLFGGSLALVLALVAGFFIWTSTHRDGPRPDRAPFFLAVDNLLLLPAAHYTGTAAGGESWDLEATNGGEMYGTVTADGQSIDVMTAGGTTYFKPPQSLLAGLATDSSSPTDTSALAGKWITGDSTLTDLVPSGLLSPTTWAYQLWTELQSPGTIFPTVGSPTAQVDGVAAYAAKTTQGTIYVAAASPYRVLRVSPEAAGAGSTSTSGSGSTSVMDLAGAGAHPAAEGLAAPAPTDFQPVSAAQLQQDYNNLINQTKALKSAVNVGIKFDFDPSGNLDCSDTNCTVDEQVTTSTTATAGASVTGGTVSANMTAAVTVDGQSAGDCTATASLPVNGSGTMSCQDGAVAPLVSQIKEKEQQQADEEAAADPGQQINIPYTVNFDASVQIEAMAQAQTQVDQTVQGEEAELEGAQQAEQAAADLAAEEQQADQAAQQSDDPCPDNAVAGAAAGYDVGAAEDAEPCGPVANQKSADPDILMSELLDAQLSGIDPILEGTPEFTQATKGTGRYLWALPEDGELTIVPVAPGIVHTVATRGGPVMAAGQISFTNGRVSSFDNMTGHYTPCPACAQTYIDRGYDEFLKNGIRIPLNVITNYGGKAP
jgi:hypothetical protein